MLGETPSTGVQCTGPATRPCRGRQRSTLGALATAVWLACTGPAPPCPAPCDERKAARLELDEPGPTRTEVVDRYGELDPGHPWAERARRVFARVRVAAEPRASVPATLVLVDGPARPEAWVLEDRTVVVNREALALCFGPEPVVGDASVDADLETAGEARLAFVLGHELSHLVANDFWHTAAFTSIEGNEVLSELVQEKLEERRRREYLADVQGLQVALIAGFRPAEFVADGPSFFHAWDRRLRELGRLPGGPHLSPEQRSEALLVELRKLERDFETFRLGTVLAAIGRDDEAVRLLERFANEHPITEARNNLGLAHYQAAARALAECDGSLVVRYRMPTRLSTVLLEERDTLRGETEVSPCYEKAGFRDHFKRGRAALESAREHAPTDVASRLNLVALLLLDHDSSASAYEPADELVDIREPTAGLAPDDPDALVAAAVTHHRFVSDMGINDSSGSLRLFDRALEITPGHPVALFDKGVVLLELGLEDEGRAALERFLEAEPTGVWADVARGHLGQPLPEAMAATRAAGPRSAPEAPIPLGGAAVYPVITEAIQRVGNARLFAPNGSVEVVLVPSRGPGPTTREELVERHGEPTDRLSTSLGEILVYDASDQGFGFELVAGEVVSTFFFAPPPLAR